MGGDLTMSVSSILNELRTHQIALKKQLAIIDKTIADFEMISNSDSQETDTATMPLELDTPEYKPKWSMKNKIKFFFQQERRFLHASEIVKLIIDRELNANVNTRQVSVALNRLLKDTENSETRIINIKHDENLRNTFWGLHTWLIPDGELPKPERMFDKDFLWENRKEEVTIE